VSGSSLATSRPSDTLLLVLDCVNDSWLTDPRFQDSALPTLRALARGSVLFDHAVTAASWTAPAIASLFTGLYPWEHGMFSLGRRTLRPGDQTLAERYAAEGYATGSFSANPHVGVASGLSRGFDVHYTGAFTDCYVRRISQWSSAPSEENGVDPTLGARLPVLRQGSRLRLAAARTAISMPAVVDIGTRILSRVKQNGDGSHSLVAPWIEPALEGWLRAQPRQRPVFCFVNLLDAHEPYVGLPEEIRRPFEWLSQMATSQRVHRRPDGTPFMSARESKILTDLYRRSIEILDRRVARLLEIFAAHRDADRLTVVLTGDHGQAFGEEGSFYHRWGVASSLHRVPLIVRPSGFSEQGRRCSQWVSTKDVGHLLEDSESLRSADPPYAASGGTSEGESAPPVLSLADVAGSNIFTEPRRDPRVGDPHMFVIGYAGRHRVVADVDALPGSAERLEVTPHDGDPTEWAELRRATHEAAWRIAAQSTPVRASRVEDRLARWGY